MSKSGASTRCPECGARAPRAIASPYVRGGAATVRYKAEARNEKSAHEPTVARRLNGGHQGHDHRQSGHGGGHSHGGGKRHRPWMVGH